MSIQPEEPTLAEVTASNRTQVALTDARDAFRSLLLDPFSGMIAAYTNLGRTRALAVGIVFASAFALTFTFAMYRLQQGLLGVFSGGGGLDLSALLKMLISGAVLPLSLFGVGVVARKALRVFDSLERDAFMTGLALLPFTLFLLIVGLLGVNSYQLLGLLCVFALCYTILLLFCGYTRLAGMSDRAAGWILPLALLVSGWLTKTVLGMLFGF